MKSLIVLTVVVVVLGIAGCGMMMHTLGGGMCGMGGHGSHGGHEGQDQESHETHQADAMNDGTPVTLTGEIIDPVCFLRHEAKGPLHQACVENCAKDGITLAIVDDATGRIFISMPEGHGDPNAKLMAYAAQHVKVTGTLWEKGGYAGIEVKTVEQL